MELERLGRVKCGICHHGDGGGCGSLRALLVHADAGGVFDCSHEQPIGVICQITEVRMIPVKGHVNAEVG